MSSSTQYDNKNARLQWSTCQLYAALKRKNWRVFLPCNKKEKKVFTTIFTAYHTSIYMYVKTYDEMKRLKIVHKKEPCEYFKLWKQKS